MFPKCINDLIDNFKKFPGVGQKSAERMAFSLLYDFDDDDIQMFSNNIIDVKISIDFIEVLNIIFNEFLDIIFSVYICRVLERYIEYKR